jgi:hypothetical protein
MLNLRPIRIRRRESVSLRRFQNCNGLKMDHFRQYGVEDEFDFEAGRISKRKRAPDSPVFPDDKERWRDTVFLAR